MVRQRGIEQAAWRRAVAWVSSPGIRVMGPGRGSTITSEWKGSNPVTPSQIRWREKDLDKEERRRERKKQRGIEGGSLRPRGGSQKCRAIGRGGMGKMWFLWSEESLMITLKECAHNLYGEVTVVRMIVVIEVSFWLRSLDGPSPLNFILLSLFQSI